MTDSKTIKTYNVFRTENQGGGSAHHLGEIEAHSEKVALELATLEFECRGTSHLYVEEVE